LNRVRAACRQVVILLLWVTVFPLLVLVTTWLDWRERMDDRGQAMVDPLWPALLVMAIVAILVCGPIVVELIAHV